MKWAPLAVFAIACGGGNSASTADAPGPDATPPTPAGCITDVSAGDHTFTCGGLAVDVRIPPACEAPGCGIILVLHGDTGTGLLMDAHVKLRELGAQHGYIVLAPTGPPWNGSGPGSTWHASNDATLVDMVTQFATVFRADMKKLHVTGFSRGGFVTWRLLCDHSDLFASAAPGGAGDGTNFGEQTCFSNNRMPARHLPILFLLGNMDTQVGVPQLHQIRDAAIANYQATGPIVVGSGTGYVHNQWSASSTVIETFEHDYINTPGGPWGSAAGHCIPGSTTDPYAPQYAIPCQLPNAFTWGDEVMAFFLAHPMP